MNRFIMMVGLPGSGKSQAAKEFFPDAAIFSSDDIRAELWGDANDQQNPSIVFHEMEVRTLEALGEGLDVVYDATNLHSRTRRSMVKLVKERYPDIMCHCILVLCPIKECKRRQSGRDRQVPDEVIDRMARSYQVPYFHEGWDGIYMYSNGGQQDIEREHDRMQETAHDNPHHTTGSINAHCTRALSAMIDLVAQGTEPTTTTDMEDIQRLLKEAAYQHDVGKRKTKVFHNTKGEPTDVAHFYGHENVGAYLWLSGDMQAKDNWDDWSFLTIGLLIQLHMMPYTFPNRSKEELVNWCSRRGYDPWIADWVWLIHLADEAAH